MNDLNIKKSFEIANHTLIDYYDSKDTDSYVPSDKFEESIKQLMCKKKKTVTHVSFKRVACLFGALIFAGALSLLLSNDTRAVFFGWFRQQHEHYVRYISPNRDSESDELAVYTPNYLPDGYEFENFRHESEQCSLIYTNGTEEVLTIIYSSQQASCEYYVNTKEAIYSSVFVNGQKADLYSSQNNGISAILWSDHKTQTFFYILAPLPEEELVRIAENIVPSR